MEGMEYEGLTCRNCREHSPIFFAGRTLFHLDAKSRELIHEIKYNGVKQVLDDMPLFFDRTPGFQDFVTDAVLIPVPLHRKKYQQRGFNQSLWIAQAWAKIAGETTVVCDCLKRVRHTATQTTLDRAHRQKNVKNAFALNDRTCLDGFERLVLVDDVYTTGATLDACAQVLIESGFPKVEVATLGHG
jgi:competence protein ComFC